MFKKIKMKNSQTIEKLAAEISKEVYIDIAKWRLYLNDAHLDIPLAEKFYLILTESGKSINQKSINEVLNDTKVKIGGGQKEISLSELIPINIQARLLDLLKDFSQSF